MPFDAILVTAAALALPQPPVDQLKPRGRLVIPVGNTDFGQELLLLQKSEEGDIDTQEILTVAFVPLTREH